MLLQEDEAASFTLPGHNLAAYGGEPRPRRLPATLAGQLRLLCLLETALTKA